MAFSLRHPWLIAGLAGAGLFLGGALAYAFAPALVDAGGARLHRLGGAPVYFTAGFLGWVGGLTALVPLFLGAAFLLLRAGRAPTALAVLAAFATEEVLVGALKAWIARPRPDLGVVASGWSFPSGHAARGALVALLAAYVLFHRKEWRRPVLASAAAFALLMAAARLVLGVHHVSDVVAGLGVGLAVGGLFMTAAHLLEERRRTVRVPVEEPAPMPAAPLTR